MLCLMGFQVLPLIHSYVYRHCGVHVSLIVSLKDWWSFESISYLEWVKEDVGENVNCSIYSVLLDRFWYDVLGVVSFY